MATRCACHLAEHKPARENLLRRCPGNRHSISGGFLSLIQPGDYLEELADVIINLLDVLRGAGVLLGTGGGSDLRLGLNIDAGSLDVPVGDGKDLDRLAGVNACRGDFFEQLRQGGFAHVVLSIGQHDQRFDVFG